MRKVYEIALVTGDIDSPKKFVVAECLDGLIQTAMQEFGLQCSKCVVVSDSGIPIESDEVLDLLYELKDSAFCLKQIETEPLDITTQTPVVENAHQETSSPEEEQVVVAELTDDLDTIDGSLDGLSAYYDDPKIIRFIREARSGITTEDLISVLKGSSICGDNLGGLVIHAAGTWLMKNCSELKEPFRPSPSEYLKMAKSITKYFPSMEKVSKNNWDIIYDGRTHKGVLERYVRQKRSREGKAIKRIVSGLHSDSPFPYKKQRLSMLSESFSEENVNEAEQFMRNNVVDKSNKQAMLHNFYVTRTSRRQFISDQNSLKSPSLTLILNKYPLLIRLNEAVEEEFAFLTGKEIHLFRKNWEQTKVKLLNLAVAECPKGKNAEIVEAKIKQARQAEIDFNTELENATIFELLLYLLPNTTAKELPRGIKTWDCLSLIVQRFEVGTTMREALQRASEMIQPGILIIGKDNHFIKIDQLFMQIPNGNLVISLAYLVAFYFILKVEYRLPLKYVFVFLESLFEIPMSKQFVVVKKLISRLAV